MNEVKAFLYRRLSETDSTWRAGYVNMLKTLKRVFLSPRHWILEFLQNADDSGARRYRIEVAESAIIIQNDGKPFDQDDFEAICDVNSRKLPSSGFRGYLGIGFKSIFRISDEVAVHSGDYHFRFSRGEMEEFGLEVDALESQVPWEVLPRLLPPEYSPGPLTTSFVVSVPGDDGRSVLGEIGDYLFGDQFPQEAILLLRHINEIEIMFAHGKRTITRRVTSASDEALFSYEVASVVNRFDGGDAHDVSDGDYLLVRREVKVPEDVRRDRRTEDARRADVTSREVGLVFQLNGDQRIVPLEGRVSGVYSFMPIEGEQTGLPFALFGDLLPQPGRDLIDYESKWNRWTCEEVNSLFKDVVNHLLLGRVLWRDFPASMLAHEMSGASVVQGVGADFWQRNMKSQIRDYLTEAAVFHDVSGRAQRITDLMIADPDVIDIIGGPRLEKWFGRSLVHPDERDYLDPAIELKIDEYVLFQHPELIGELHDELSTLAALFKCLSRRNDYYLGGWAGKETPLAKLQIVVGQDGKMHSPSEMSLLKTNLSELPSFLHAAVPTDRYALHQVLANDAEAVAQLERCGVEVVDHQTIVSNVSDLLAGIESRDDCPDSWTYPSDYIEAVLFAVANHAVLPKRLVGEGDVLQSVEYVFLRGSPLSWGPLWDSNLLPGFLPLHPDFSNPRLMSRLGITTHDLYQQLEQAGVHGFSEQADRRLTETVGEAVAKRQLAIAGHIIADVTDNDRLGYDFECSNHCNKVFEVKGMTKPRDETLPESEVNAAIERGADYVLVFVHGLPTQPDSVGYKEVVDPQRIWLPRGTARVPLARWSNE